MKIEPSHPLAPFDSRAEGMLAASGSYPLSDHPLFLAGYSELCRTDLNGHNALEICGGAGKLAELLAETFPQSHVTGIDLYIPEDPELEKRLARLPGLSYVAGDAFDLSQYPPEYFEVVWGQAALHHLAHDADGLSKEVLRVLKPGGRLVFIFEPLGHNYLVAAIRAVRMARHEMGDESNLYFSQFQRMLDTGYSKCEVQVFNLFGYPLKALSDRFAFLSSGIRKLDACLFRKFPKLLRYGANCNLVLTKGDTENIAVQLQCDNKGKPE